MRRTKIKLQTRLQTLTWHRLFYIVRTQALRVGEKMDGDSADTYEFERCEVGDPVLATDEEIDGKTDPYEIAELEEWRFAQAEFDERTPLGHKHLRSIGVREEVRALPSGGGNPWMEGIITPLLLRSCVRRPLEEDLRYKGKRRLRALRILLPFATLLLAAVEVIKTCDVVFERLHREKVETQDRTARISRTFNASHNSSSSDVSTPYVNWHKLLGVF